LRDLEGSRLSFIFLPFPIIKGDVCKKEGGEISVITEIVILITDSRCLEEHKYIVMVIDFDDYSISEVVLPLHYLK